MSRPRPFGTDRHTLGRAVLVAIGITLTLYALAWWLPMLGWLAWPLLLFSTIAHELGHGLTALLLGADFERLLVYADGSGVAEYRAAFGAPAQALVAAMGPLGPPLVAAVLFVAARHARSARLALFALGAAFLLAAGLWAGNVFGFMCLLTFAAGMLWLAWRGSTAAHQIAVAFLAIQLSLAAFSRADYLFSATANTGAGPMPSDTTQIAMALGLTHWVWGTLLAVCSLAVLVFGARVLLRALR